MATVKDTSVNNPFIDQSNVVVPTTPIAITSVQLDAITDQLNTGIEVARIDSISDGLTRLNDTQDKSNFLLEGIAE